ncbi:hypothetical protein I3W98_04155, partial [Streptomyces cavourensis]|nr:hypothetical protein [Streptomyces cavourensis]
GFDWFQEKFDYAYPFAKYPARRPVPGALGRRQRGPHWVLHPVATPSRNCD